MAAAPRVGRLRSSPPSPLGPLCHGAAARAAHPGREAPLPPAPLPLARPPGRAGRRAHAPLAPSRARPARPQAGARPGPAASSPRRRSPALSRFSLFPV